MWCLGGCDGVARKTASPFTQAEVTAGHASYHGYCAGCHGDALQGGGSQGGSDAPQLTGANFNQDWSKQTIKVLYRYVSKTMPDGLAGDLDAKTYRNVLAFLLAANGAKPGSTPFDPNSSIKIGDITNGRLVPAVVNAR
jgi:cytochrome c